MRNAPRHSDCYLLIFYLFRAKSLYNPKTCSIFARPLVNGYAGRHTYFCDIGSQFAVAELRLKGNRVQIPDSPAAVSFKQCFGALCYDLTTVGKVQWEGIKEKTSQKTCRIVV